MFMMNVLRESAGLLQGSRSSVVGVPTEALGSISSGCPGVFVSNGLLYSPVLCN